MAGGVVESSLMHQAAAVMSQTKSLRVRALSLSCKYHLNDPILPPSQTLIPSLPIVSCQKLDWNKP